MYNNVIVNITFNIFTQGNKMQTIIITVKDGMEEDMEDTIAQLLFDIGFSDDCERVGNTVQVTTSINEWCEELKHWKEVTYEVREI